MWQKGSHKDFVYFWTDSEENLKAGLSMDGYFILWSTDGRYDSVRCDHPADALEIMEQLIQKKHKKKK